MAKTRKDDEHGAVFVERLRGLFDTITYVDDRGRRRRFANHFVAEQISADTRHDISLSRTYIDGLRNGRQRNPSRNTLHALALFFEDHRDPDAMAQTVTVGYLLGEDPASAVEEETDQDLRAALADRDVRGIALRAAHADAMTRKELLDILDALERRRQSEPDSDA